MNKKFTLIELLVVVAIIGILAAMILPALGTARDKAQQKTCTNNLKQIGTSMIMYFSDGSEINMPAQASYIQSEAQSGDTEWGALWQLEDGALSCNAKREDTNAVDEKVYGPCTGIASASFAAVEDPQTRVATDTNVDAADSHKSGGKANVLAGDGHVESTTSGLAQRTSEL
jgi:prepilin-type N-terminal cleavage/methylation domain-containing protein/prepilin-type processing-associated H-X9-DG protein